MLELLLGDGEVAATAVQQHMEGGPPTVEVFQDGRLVYREADGRVVKPQTSQGSDACSNVSGSNTGAGSDTSSSSSSSGNSNWSPRGPSCQPRPTHRAVLSRTPLVKHLDWVALKGTGGGAPPCCCAPLLLRCLTVPSLHVPLLRILAQ